MFENKLVTGQKSVEVFCGDVCKVSILSEFANYCSKLYIKNEAARLRKTEFSPPEVVSVLPFIVISELKSDGVFFRLAGTLVEPIFDRRSIVGKNIADYVPEENRHAVFDFFSYSINNNLVSFQEEDLELAEGDILSCSTLGFPFEDDKGMRRFRMSVTYYTHKGRHIINPADYRVKHSKVHNVRFVELNEFMNTLNDIA
jgi:hypothetical protein